NESGARMQINSVFNSGEVGRALKQFRMRLPLVIECLSITEAFCLHAGRVACGDRHHRDLDCAVAAGRSSGPRGAAARSVQKQSQADWPCLAHTYGCPQVFSVGRMELEFYRRS